MMQDLVVHGVFMLYVLAFLMGLATIFTWVERKQSAVMSDRIGANRCLPAHPVHAGQAGARGACSTASPTARRCS